MCARAPRTPSPGSADPCAAPPRRARADRALSVPADRRAPVTGRKRSVEGRRDRAARPEPGHRRHRAARAARRGRSSRARARKPHVEPPARRAGGRPERQARRTADSAPRSSRRPSRPGRHDVRGAPRSSSRAPRRRARQAIRSVAAQLAPTRRWPPASGLDRSGPRARARPRLRRCRDGRFEPRRSRAAPPPRVRPARRRDPSRTGRPR